MNWFAGQRQIWILETIRVFGFINREHLMKKFGISLPQSSNDLREFQLRYPNVLTYDKSQKCYRRLRDV